MKIAGLDHLVLTVTDLERTLAFYTRNLGMEPIRFGDNRHALRFGRQKINLHLAGAEITPHAASPVPGAADLCLLLETPLEEAIDELRANGVPILLGPVERTGACGPLRSIYLRDPDGNLIELASASPPP